VALKPIMVILNYALKRTDVLNIGKKKKKIERSTKIFHRYVQTHVEAMHRKIVAETKFLDRVKYLNFFERKISEKKIVFF
jgi:hypothetical protein